MKFLTGLLSCIHTLFRGDGKPHVKTGDVVSVLSHDEILQTLDENNCCEGLVFMQNMKQFCGRDYQVLKQVKWIYDEKCKKMQYCKDVVALDGPVCEGKGMLRGRDCDRCCTLLWKTAWLKTKGDKSL